MVRWLRLQASKARAWVWPLVRESRSLKLRGVAKRRKATGKVKINCKGVISIKECPPALASQWSGQLGESTFQFSSVQLLSRVRLFATPWTAAHQASLSITNSKFTQIHVHSSQWCHPTISSSVIPFSSCRLFKWVSSSPQVAKVLEFQLQYQSF